MGPSLQPMDYLDILITIILRTTIIPIIPTYLLAILPTTTIPILPKGYSIKIVKYYSHNILIR